MSRHSIGVDVGGTKILGVVVDAEDPTEPLAEHRLDTPLGVDPLLERIAEVVAELRDRYPAAGGGPVPVGVGLPALVDRHGVPAFATHLPGFTGVPVAERLRAATGSPVVVDNDANCAVVAEARLGAAAGSTEVVLVTLGTGIGGGVVTDGRLLRGANGFAGEIGHVLVVRDGRPCPCGRRGCWEQYASGNGLGISARDAARGGRADAVLAAAGELAAIRGEHVVAAAQDRDPDALRLLTDLGWWVAAGIADLVNVLDPQVVVLGGGLVAAGDLLLQPVRAAYEQMVIGAAHRPPVPIELATLGPAAGAIGAALLAADGPGAASGH